MGKTAEGMQQTEFDAEGMSPEVIPQLEEVAKPLKEARYERIALQSREQELEKQLVGRMVERKVKAYPVGDKVARLTETTVMKIKFEAAKTTEMEGK